MLLLTSKVSFLSDAVIVMDGCECKNLRFTKLWKTLTVRMLDRP